MKESDIAAIEERARSLVGHFITRDGVRFRLIDDAIALISEVRRAQWQPIETAPKDYDVLVWGKGLSQPIMAIYRDCTVPASSGWYYSYGGGRCPHPQLLSEYPMQFEFTHWMPLPEPPARVPS
jgi:hypothetical protein